MFSPQVLSKQPSTCSSEDSDQFLCPVCASSVVVTHKPLQTLQAHLAKATATIRKLKEDKQTLKAALTETLAKHSQLAARLPQVTPENSRLNALREALFERDRTISELQLSPTSQLKLQIDQVTQQLLTSTKAYPEIHSILQNAVVNYQPPAEFLLSALKATQAVLKLVKGPKTTEVHSKLIKDSQSIMEDCPKQFEKIFRLNQELTQSLARSESYRQSLRTLA